MTMDNNPGEHQTKGCGEPRETKRSEGSPTGGQRHRRWRRAGFILFLAVGVLGIGRAVLPGLVRDYINRTLERSPLYTGRLGKVQIRLWRGAYSIQDIRLSKITGNIPVPLFAANRVDFALQWDALFHRRLVGRIVMQEPELNFVDAPSEDNTQTGKGGPWLEMIRNLFPFTINSAVIQDGSIHFRTYQAKHPVDVYVSHIEGSVEDLSNIQRETKPLVTTVQAAGLVMDQAKMEFRMALDPFAYRPTFHLALRLLGLDVTKLNALSQAYGKFDFKGGSFDLVIESEAREGQITGYVKPLFRHLKVFSLAEDLKEDNSLRFFWQALIGGVTSALKNPARDQFGTLINFKGDASGTTSEDLLATIGNTLRNAFIRAYLPRLEGGRHVIEGLKFEPPDLSAPISVADGP